MWTLQLQPSFGNTVHKILPRRVGTHQGQPAIFLLKTELAERSEHSLSFSLSFCCQQSRSSSYKSKYFPTNLLSEMEFQARKSTIFCSSRKSKLVNTCTVATYLEILMGYYCHCILKLYTENFTILYVVSFYKPTLCIWKLKALWISPNQGVRLIVSMVSFLI